MPTPSSLFRLLTPAGLALITGLLMSAPLSASLPEAPSRMHSLAPVEHSRLEAIDIPALREAHPVQSGQPLMFSRASSNGASLDDGHWQQLDNGDWLWRYSVQSPNALSLSPVFRRLSLPDDAQLYLVDQFGQTVGPAVSSRHLRHDGRFYAAVVPGQRLNLELQVSAEQRDQVRLQLEAINQGFRPIDNELALLDEQQRAALSNSAGGCNIDIACPEADDWQEIASSVARFTFQTSQGGSLCTGQLIASTEGTAESLFLTANHCLSTNSAAQSMVLYFNYRSPQCRNTISGPRAGINPASNSDIHYGGTELLATAAATDFTLVRLEQAVEADVEPYFTGWDRRDRDIEGGVYAIHHPAGTEQRFSFSSVTAHRSPSLNSANRNLVDPDGSHLRVPRWELGTTEGGSSGSGLWDNQQRLVGQLHGGGAACGNQEPDWYGRLYRSWDGPNPQSRLRDWLDPGGTAAEFIDGSSACLQPSISLQRDSATAVAGNPVNFSVVPTGGAGGPWQVDWDTSGNGQADLQGESISLTFHRPGPQLISVTVSDRQDCSARLSFSQSVSAPDLTASATAPPQRLSGSGEGYQPGDRWQIPVRLTNSGDEPLIDGLVAMVSGADGGLGEGEYTVLGANSSDCGYNWISRSSQSQTITFEPSPDISAAPEDEGISPMLALHSGFRLFDQTVDGFRMSTNGYLSSAEDETGSDFVNACPLPAAPGSGGGNRLLAYHDDLVTNDAWYQQFSNCPRPADTGQAQQACTVFTWQEAEFFGESEPPFAFQAIVYESSKQVVYQYQSNSSSRGDSASIGLQTADLTQAASFSCKQRSLQVGNNAVCLNHPEQTASSGDNLRLVTPAIELPQSLAPGESHTSEVEFQIPDDAECGAPLVLSMGAWAGRNAGSDQWGSTVLEGSIASNCQAASNDPVVSLLPRGGLWWNPERAGNGLDMYQVPGSNTLALLWYTADEDRNPIWYIAQGPLQNNRLTADLLRFSWDGAASSEVAGQLLIDFVSEDRALMSWRIDNRQGAMPIESFRFGVGPGSENNTGVWFDPGESGWGLTFNNQMDGAGNDIETTIVYFYDQAGRPVWSLGQGLIGDEQLNLQQFFVACPHCPWSSTQGGEATGTVERAFESLFRGVVSVDLQLAPPLQGQWQRDSEIERLTTPLDED